MQIVTDEAGLEQAVHHHKLAAMMGVEGGHMIEDRMDYLDSFYRRGVRYMTLTWNNGPPWATSALDETSKAFIVTSYGLTDPCLARLSSGDMNQAGHAGGSLACGGTDVLGRDPYGE